MPITFVDPRAVKRIHLVGAIQAAETMLQNTPANHGGERLELQDKLTDLRQQLAKLDAAAKS